jgi:hypothetical protein
MIDTTSPFILCGPDSNGYEVIRVKPELLQAVIDTLNKQHCDSPESAPGTVQL